MATDTKEKQQIKETTLKNTKLSTVKLDWKEGKTQECMKHKNTSRSRGRKIVTALAATSAVASAALGQVTNEAAADPMAAFKTDKGLISLTKAAPELTPVSDYTGEFWSRATLLGDPGNWRTRAYDSGLTLDAQLTQVFLVVDVVGVEVGLAGVAEVVILHADFLILFPGPAQLLVHVAGGDEWAVGVVHLFPIQLHDVQFRVFERCLFDLLLFFCIGGHNCVFQFISLLISGPAVMAVCS